MTRRLVRLRLTRIRGYGLPPTFRRLHDDLQRSRISGHRLIGNLIAGQKRQVGLRYGVFDFVLAADMERRVYRVAEILQSLVWTGCDGMHRNAPVAHVRHHTGSPDPRFLRAAEDHDVT